MQQILTLYSIGNRAAHTPLGLLANTLQGKKASNKTMEKLKHRHGLKNPSNFCWLFYSRDDFCPLISIVLTITLDHHAGSMAHPLPLYWSQSNSKDEVVVETARHILLKAKVMDLASLPVCSTPPTKHTLDAQ